MGYDYLLPHFRAMVELGNYSQDLDKSMKVIKATETVYKRVCNDSSEEFHDSLLELHEKLRLKIPRGQTSVFRFTTQYFRPATFRVSVSYDNDGDGERFVQYFSRTTDVFDNSEDLEAVAYSIIIGAMKMLEKND